jgi:hypothetical protein
MLTIKKNGIVLLQAQDVFAVVIIAAIVDYIVGVFIGPLNDTQRAQGFVGLSGKFTTVK